MRMSRRRLAAMVRALHLGIDILIIEGEDADEDFDPDTDDEVRAAQEGYRYLVRWLNEMEKVES